MLHVYVNLCTERDIYVGRGMKNLEKPLLLITYMVPSYENVICNVSYSELPFPDIIPLNGSKSEIYVIFSHYDAVLTQLNQWWKNL